jgi:hypothetical protein
MKLRGLRIAAAAAVAVFAATAANADVIDWTQWNSATPGLTGGSAAGTMGAVTVSYSGWTPSTSYVGGTIGNAPLPSNNMIQLMGGANTGVNTITFSTALLNPVLAIWSLGQSGDPTSFDFGAQPFTIQAGGPSAEYAGEGLTAVGNVVQGIEGNGVIQFSGLVTSISFTNPAFENWYGFTVGNDISGAVPEPATWAMFLLGFGAIGWTLRAARAKAAVTA